MMLFNSYSFLMFFPVVTLLYFVLPKRMRTVCLLGASYYFYMCWNPYYALLIAGSTLMTYGCGCALGKPENRKQQVEQAARKKAILWLCLGSNLAMLTLFKYSGFLLEMWNAGTGCFALPPLGLPFNLILPVGISFYVFQALGYTLDVAAGKIEPEKNLVRYALFVSFFPQLVAGPIERSGNLLRQIQDIPTAPRPSYQNVVNGLVLMVWGLFQKMVIADRIALFVNEVYGTYWNYNAIALILASVLFAFQIYCDFASYSTIAIGAAQVLGFSLMENFNAPYLSHSILEFWSRWHISLSRWFQDYLYIPLGGNRKGVVRRNANILLVFFLSGLWHGAGWNFIAWGLLHGVFQIVARWVASVRRKRGHAPCGAPLRFSDRLLQVVGTFVMVDVAWVFFRAASIEDALAILGRMLTRFDPWALVDGSLYEIALSRAEFRILFLALIMLCLVDFLQWKKGVRVDAFLQTQALWFRWAVVIGWVLCIFVLGVYGPAYEPQAFIYFQF